MNFLADFGLVASLATGYLIAGLVGAVVLARIALAARDWLNRNNWTRRRTDADHCRAHLLPRRRPRP